MIEEKDAATPAPVDRSAPCLYVLDLLPVDGAADRIRQTGASAERLLRWSKRTGGDHPALLVVDEAQELRPDQQTGRLGASRRSARVNEDVLSECSLILRVVSAEDLAAVAGCFEHASERLLRDRRSTPLAERRAADRALGR